MFISVFLDVKQSVTLNCGQAVSLNVFVHNNGHDHDIAEMHGKEQNISY